MRLVPDAAHSVKVNHLRPGLCGEAGVDGVGLPLLALAQREGEGLRLHQQAGPVVPVVQLTSYSGPPPADLSSCACTAYIIQ